MSCRLLLEMSLFSTRCTLLLLKTISLPGSVIHIAAPGAEMMHVAEIKLHLPSLQPVASLESV